MHLETQDLSPVLKRINVTVPRARVDGGFAGTYNQLARTAAVPGFRRGHVPRGVIVKRFLKQATSDVLQGILSEGWKKALDDFELVPVAQPGFEGGQPREGADFAFSFIVEVTPEVALRPYEELTVEQVTWLADDAIVEHELEHVAEQVAAFHTITDRDVIADGDQIIFDYRGSIDGVAFPGGAAEHAELVLGSGRFIPGFEAQLIGRTVGEDLAIDVTFPVDYGAQELAGKLARFDCKVHEIRVKRLPAVGPELAEALHEPDMDAVRASVRGQVLQHYNRQTERAIKDSLRDQLVDLHVFELPPTLVNEELQHAAQQVFQRAVQEQKMLADQAMALIQAQKDELEAKVIANLRRRFVLNAIADRENIDVQAPEVTAYIEEMARGLGRHGNQVRQMYRDANQRDRLKLQMRDDRVLDFLMGKATVTQVERAVPAHDHGHDPEGQGEPQEGSNPTEAAGGAAE